MALRLIPILPLRVVGILRWHPCHFRGLWWMAPICRHCWHTTPHPPGSEIQMRVDEENASSCAAAPRVSLATHERHLAIGVDGQCGEQRLRPRRRIGSKAVERPSACVWISQTRRHRYRCRYRRSPPAVATFMNYVRAAWSWSCCCCMELESAAGSLESLWITLSHFSAARQFWGEHGMAIAQHYTNVRAARRPGHLPVLDPSSDSRSPMDAGDAVAVACSTNCRARDIWSGTEKNDFSIRSKFLTIRIPQTIYWVLFDLSLS